MSDLREPYELAILPDAADIDELGHVNNVTYLRWVQDAAVAHWMAAAPVEEKARLLWIVLHHEIDYLHAAHMEDSIVARTWVGTATRLRFDRHTEILRAADRLVLARARTVWCPLDAVSRKPAHVSPEVRAKFSVTSPEPGPAGDPC
jgi:acyl-CoA thioester hydrolase